MIKKSFEKVLNWNQFLNNREPELAWRNFLNYIFSSRTRRYIYTHNYSLKSTFSSPWFNFESYEAYRDKKWHIGINNEIKFSIKIIRSFKNLCNQKMKDNLYNDEDPDLITRKTFF